MQLAFALLDVSRSSSFPHEVPKMIICSLEGGIITLWMPLSLAVIIPDSLVYYGSFPNFKMLKVSELKLRRTLGHCR